jgi:membrane protease YdiL (CAAX protease family)
MKDEIVINDWRLVVAVLVEVTYVVFTRTWLPEHFKDVIELEWLTTACRIVAALIFWWLFRDAIKSVTPSPQRVKGIGLFVLAMVIVCLVPLIFSAYPPSTRMRLVFGLTSIVVAVKEELFYRGILQRALIRQYGLGVGFIVCNVIFVLYHFGAQSFALWGLVELFSMGCILGMTYLVFGSLLWPIVLHGIYDAAWSLGPLGDRPDNMLRIPFFAVGLALVWFWWRRNHQPSEGRKR